MRKIWRAIWNRQRFEDDLADEMRFHVEARAADLERAGWDKAKALREARLELGAAEHHKEACRQARGLRWLDEFRLDLLYALRGLGRNKAFAAVAIATLALGIGANAAIFALVNSVLLKALPVPNPEQLQAVYWVLPGEKKTFHTNSSGRAMREGNVRVRNMFSYPHFERLRAELAPKADLFGHEGLGRINVTVHGQAQLARGLATSWNYFSALRVAPQLGRTFVPEDETAATPALVVLLSHAYWRNTFGGDRSILGREIGIGDQKATVVGILPPGFHGIDPGESMDVVMTLTAWDQISKAESRNDARRWWVKMMARLQPGTTAAQLREETETRLVNLLRAEPVREHYDAPKIRLIDGTRGLHWMRQEIEKPLQLVMLTALLILLMAAVNVGGLMLARSESRVAETSARLALGAGRLRVARQHLTESLVLALAGLAGGLFLAGVFGSALVSLLARGGQAPEFNLLPDARFAAIALAGTLVTAMVFGLYPAWRSSRLQLGPAMKRAGGARTGRLPMGKVLVATQVGLSLVLLIAAGGFLRTIWNLRSLTLGFTPDHLLVFSADPTQAGYRDQQVVDYYNRAQQSLSAAPGVRLASFSRYGFLQGGAQSTGFSIGDSKGGPPRDLGGVRVHSIAPGYFETVGVPLLAGRSVRNSDTQKAQRVILINQKLARLVRPDGGSPIGLTLIEGDRARTPYEIIGVTGDAKYNSLRDDVPLTVYRPFAQTNIRGATFFVKSSGDPLSMASTVRRVMSAVDSSVPIYDMCTQEEQISLAMERERSLAKLLAGFGVLALLLAAVGVYGVLSYSVTRRTSEIGVRLALGAQPAALRTMIVRESLPAVVVGGACGLYAAWWFTRLLESFLFGVKPMDEPSVAGAVAVLGLAAAFATLIPAYRASRVSPMSALRYE